MHLYPIALVVLSVMVLLVHGVSFISGQKCGMIVRIIMTGAIYQKVWYMYCTLAQYTSVECRYVLYVQITGCALSMYYVGTYKSMDGGNP